MTDVLKPSLNPMKSMVRVFDPARNHGYYGVLLTPITGAGHRAVLAPRHGLLHASPTTTTVYRLGDTQMAHPLGVYIQAEAGFTLRSDRIREDRISPHDIGLLYFRATTDLSDLPGWDIMAAIEAPPTNVYGAATPMLYYFQPAIHSASRTITDVGQAADSSHPDWYDEIRWAVAVDNVHTAMVNPERPVSRSIRSDGGAFPVRSLALGTTAGCSGGMVYSPETGTFGMIISGRKSQDPNDNLTLLETLSSLQMTCRMSKFLQL